MDDLKWLMSKLRATLSQSNKSAPLGLLKSVQFTL